jgi:hypothetical protein
MVYVNSNQTRQLIMLRGTPKKDSIRNIDTPEVILQIEPEEIDTQAALNEVRKVEKKSAAKALITPLELLQSNYHIPLENRPKSAKDIPIFFENNNNWAIAYAKTPDLPLQIYEVLAELATKEKNRSIYLSDNELLGTLILNLIVPIELLRQNIDHPCYDIRRLIAKRFDLNDNELKQLSDFDLQKKIGGKDGFTHLFTYQSGYSNYYNIVWNAIDSIKKKKELEKERLIAIEATDVKTPIDRILYLMGFSATTKFCGSEELVLDSNKLGFMYNFHPEEVIIAAINNPSLPIEHLEKFILLESQKGETNSKFIKAAKSVLSKRQTL